MISWHFSNSWRGINLNTILQIHDLSNADPNHADLVVHFYLGYIIFKNLRGVWFRLSKLISIASLVKPKSISIPMKK